MSRRDARARGAPRARRAGMVAIAVVLSLGLVIAGLLTATEADVAPLARDVRLRAARAQARALAEAGVEAARADAARGAPPAALAGLRLGDGVVDVAVAVEGDEVVVRACGRAPAPLLLGPGGAVSRTVVARLRGGQVTAWEEVP